MAMNDYVTGELGHLFGKDMAALVAPPPRMFLVNMATGEEMALPANPSTLPTNIKPDYTKQRGQGFTSQTLHYNGTDSPDISVEFFLFYEPLAHPVPQGGAWQLIEMERFLLSLFYPVEDAGTVWEHDTPPVLFVWPGVISAMCKAEQIGMNRVQFQRTDLKPMVAKATVKFTPIRSTRISSEEVRERGLLWQ